MKMTMHNIFLLNYKIVPVLNYKLLTFKKQLASV